MALNQVTLNTWQKHDEKISTGSIKKKQGRQDIIFLI